MSIIAKKKVQFSRGGRVCIRTLRCARPGAGKMLRDSHRERGAFKFIFLGQSTVFERARYNSVLHSKKERIQKKERVVADHDAAVEKAHEDETLSTMRARRKTITSAKVLKANERENANKETETTKVVNAMRGRIEELENELKRKDRVERRDKLKVQRLERENTKLKRLLATA